MFKCHIDTSFDVSPPNDENQHLSLLRRFGARVQRVQFGPNTFEIFSKAKRDWLWASLGVRTLMVRQTLKGSGERERRQAAARAADRACSKRQAQH
jgi:hypothetical protein